MRLAPAEPKFDAERHRVEPFAFVAARVPREFIGMSILGTIRPLDPSEAAGPPRSSDSAHSLADVSRLLDVPAPQVKTLARYSLWGEEATVPPEPSFTFQDLVLLRTAKGLRDAGFSYRRIRHAMERVRDQIPEGQTATSVRLAAEGRQIVARDGVSVWRPESGQTVLDFEDSSTGEPEARLPVSLGDVASARQAAKERELERPASEVFDLAFEIEGDDRDRAIELYRAVLAQDSDHFDAQVNLGRLLHERGELDEAEALYRRALLTFPGHPVASFNLGVVLEDLDRPREALEAYELALDCEPESSDTLYNAFRLCEELQERAKAIQYLARYRQLTGKEGR